MLRSRYACFFCGETITKEDRNAVHFAVTNLWAGRPAQGFQAHSTCAKAHVPSEHFFPECLSEDDEFEDPVEAAGRMPWWGCLAPLIFTVAGVLAVFAWGE